MALDRAELLAVLVRAARRTRSHVVRLAELARLALDTDAVVVGERVAVPPPRVLVLRELGRGALERREAPARARRRCAPEAVGFDAVHDAVEVARARIGRVLDHAASRRAGLGEALGSARLALEVGRAWRAGRRVGMWVECVDGARLARLGDRVAGEAGAARGAELVVHVVDGGVALAPLRALEGGRVVAGGARDVGVAEVEVVGEVVGAAGAACVLAVDDASDGAGAGGGGLDLRAGDEALTGTAPEFARGRGGGGGGGVGEGYGAAGARYCPD